MDFTNGQKVKIVLTGAIGRVIGTGDFIKSGREYLVEYASSEGVIDSRWFSASEIEAV